MSRRLLLGMAVDQEQDVVLARQKARQLAALLGFGAQDQIRIATSVSEVVRNALRYAGGGRVEFALGDLDGDGPALCICVSDQGPGIASLQQVLEGRYVSSTGMGLGLLGARRLMDRCEIDTAPGAGTRVTLCKLLPPEVEPLGEDALCERLAQLRKAPADSSYDEVRRQNQELITTMAALRERQDELLRLTRELEDTNRGVVALYAELDQTAEQLRRADQTKSRFLAHMSHEFRTPLNAIRALARLLQEGADGPLNDEQQTQARLIVDAAEELTALVDDLLDMAKIEAGRVALRPADFDFGKLFSAVRGMLKPLQVWPGVELVFEAPALGIVHGDESKIAQILRNLVSNALKFTRSGWVRVSARALDDERFELVVADTGLGITEGDQALVFEEFAQVNNELQRHLTGTGLGLPLCKRLATLLGGAIRVESAPGRGSTFTVTLPMRQPGVQQGDAS